MLYLVWVTTDLEFFSIKFLKWSFRAWSISKIPYIRTSIANNKRINRIITAIKAD